MTHPDLKGTIVPLVTPFRHDESLDAEGLEHLIDFVMAQGADGLMPTALTGEGPLLTSEETLAVWDVVFGKTAGALPVVPAIITTRTAQAIRMAREAERRGASAVMIAPIVPELYATRAEDDVYGFYADIAGATALPIILFNYPSLTGVDFTPSLVVRLASIAAIRYIKESSGDTRRVHAIHRLVGDRISVICGAPNTALESLALGCTAWITGIMNVVPRASRQLLRAVVEQGDLPLARRIYYTQVLPVVDVMARNNNPTGTLKAGVAARGVNVGVPRRPGQAATPADSEALERLIAGIALAEAAQAL